MCAHKRRSLKGLPEFSFYTYREGCTIESTAKICHARIILTLPSAGSTNLEIGYSMSFLCKSGTHCEFRVK